MPTQVGRYTVTRVLGQGGMAIVYAAYDPSLDRRVAIKVLRTSAKDHRFSLGQARLQREAQTLARLSHPNVVQVYEVGRVGDQLFIAMELVAGQTLRAWLQQQPRRWREIVRVFLAAGEGLAAAHTLGIVHRDFKPDNVLVGEDGRVRVLDFGLARLDEPPEHASLDSATTTSEILATVAGTVLGTPAYMAPEQHIGTPIDGRTDQFAFCIALFEALYGVRPFAGTTLPELQLSVLHGKFVALPRQPTPSHPPAWLHRLLVRGLQVSPDDRFVDMPALLTALADDPAVRRRRYALGIAVLMLLLGGLALSLHIAALRERRCTSANDNLVGIWDDAQRQTIAQALTTTDLPYATATWAAVERRLDTYADQWVQQTTVACTATHLRGEASTELLDLRTQCLNRRLQALKALTTLLARADRQVVERAVAAVESLPPVAACADDRYVRARIEPPSDPVLASSVAGLEHQLAAAQASLAAGNPTASLNLATTAVTTAERLRYPPIVAAARFHRGKALRHLASFTDAHTDLEEAFHSASSLGDDDLAALAALELAQVNRETSAYQIANGWTRHAENASTRSGGEATLRAQVLVTRAQLLTALGQTAAAEPLLIDARTVLSSAAGHQDLAMTRIETELANVMQKLGRYHEARAQLLQTRERLAALTGRQHPEYAAVLSLLATVHISMRELTAAQALYTEELAIVMRIYGEQHPRAARLYNNLGYLLLEQQDLGAAAVEFTRALNVLEQIHGPEDPVLVVPIINLAHIAEQRQDVDVAISHYLRALAIVENKLGPDHAEVARVADGLGNYYFDLGRLSEAEVMLVRAVEVCRQTRSEQDADRNISIAGLGRLRAAQGRVLEALALHEEALHGMSQSLPADHVYLAYPLTGIGRAQLALGELDAARRALERAIELYVADESSPSDIAEPQFLLAKVLWADPSTRAQARELAEAARRGYAEDPRRARDLAEVEDWLTANPLRATRREKTDSAVAPPGR